MSKQNETLAAPASIRNERRLHQQQGNVTWGMRVGTGPDITPPALGAGLQRAVSLSGPNDWGGVHGTGAKEWLRLLTWIKTKQKARGPAARKGKAEYGRTTTAAWFSLSDFQTKNVCPPPCGTLFPDFFSRSWCRGRRLSGDSGGTVLGEWNQLQKEPEAAPLLPARPSLAFCSLLPWGPRAPCPWG